MREGGREVGGEGEKGREEVRRRGGGKEWGREGVQGRGRAVGGEDSSSERGAAKQ